MSIITLEGVVDNGEIRLTSNVRLPENTKVYVVVPDFEIEQRASIHSPRLAQPQHTADFEMEIIEEPPSAGV